MCGPEEKPSKSARAGGGGRSNGWGGPSSTGCPAYTATDPANTSQTSLLNHVLPSYLLCTSLGLAASSKRRVAAARRRQCTMHLAADRAHQHQPHTHLYLSLELWKMASMERWASATHCTCACCRDRGPGHQPAGRLAAAATRGL